LSTTRDEAFADGEPDTTIRDSLYVAALDYLVHRPPGRATGLRLPTRPHRPRSSRRTSSARIRRCVSDRTYPTVPDRIARITAGHSMGGSGCLNPDRRRWAAALDRRRTGRSTPTPHHQGRAHWRTREHFDEPEIIL